jgi:hypothetical protein
MGRRRKKGPQGLQQRYRGAQAVKEHQQVLVPLLGLQQQHLLQC